MSGTGDIQDSEETEPDEIMSYETKEGTVWYDFENPCAWIKTEEVVDVKENV